MAESLARFLADGGPSLLASFVLFLVVAVALVALGIAGLVLHLREPRGDPPSRNLGPAIRLLVAVIACLPALVAIGGALAERADALVSAPVAATDMRSTVLLAGISAVINLSTFVAFQLVLLPPLAGAALAIWGPLRTRAIDLWHAHRLEREVEP